MATATYTLSADELATAIDYVNTIRRNVAMRQLVSFMQRMDTKYGATANNGVNGLAPRKISNAGVVSIDTADTALLDQALFFP